MTIAFNKCWTLAAMFLVAIVIVGSIVALARYSPGKPIEIPMAPEREWQGDIYIVGAVANPGLYSLAAGDSIEKLIRIAGGTTGSADISRLKLYLPELGTEQEAQKIDINRAEVWLLEALPGIGETLAQRIVDYREQNGPFRSTSALLKVAGIGTTAYEQIEHLITVADQN